MESTKKIVYTITIRHECGDISVIDLGFIETGLSNLGLYCVSCGGPL